MNNAWIIRFSCAIKKSENSEIPPARATFHCVRLPKNLNEFFNVSQKARCKNGKWKGAFRANGAAQKRVGNQMTAIFYGIKAKQSEKSLSAPTVCTVFLISSLFFSLISENKLAAFESRISRTLAEDSADTLCSWVDNASTFAYSTDISPSHLFPPLLSFRLSVKAQKRSHCSLERLRAHRGSLLGTFFVRWNRTTHTYFQEFFEWNQWQEAHSTQDGWGKSWNPPERPRIEWSCAAHESQQWAYVGWMEWW